MSNACFPLFAPEAEAEAEAGIVFARTIQVDSANKYGILLEVVQVLTDLKLIVKKAYISSDGGWFMDGM
jgi:hypothetical protein